MIFIDVNTYIYILHTYIHTCGMISSVYHSIMPTQSGFSHVFGVYSEPIEIAWW